MSVAITKWRQVTGDWCQVFNIIGFTLTAKRVELISRIRHRADIRYQEVQHPLSVLK
jgi:hypothetical protein